MLDILACNFVQSDEMNCNMILEIILWYGVSPQVPSSTNTLDHVAFEGAPRKTIRRDSSGADSMA